MTDNKKRYIKEFEFSSEETQTRARQLFASARDNLFVMEYDGQPLFSMPLIVVVGIVTVAAIIAFPVTVIISIALAGLGMFGKLRVRIQPQ